MELSQLLPYTDAIPVHWGWLHFFLLFTFLLHILVMNAMLGSGIIAFISSLKANMEDEATERMISSKLPFAIAFTVNLGVAPLLFIQGLYGHLVYTSSVMMATYWLSIVGLLLIAYYSAYLYDFKFDAPAKIRTYFIGVSVVLLLGIGFLFSNNMTLMLTPEKWVSYLENPNGTFLNLSEPILIPRYLHFVVGSIAVGGLFLTILWKFSGDQEKRKKSMRWFTYSTCFQFPIGFWFLFALKPGVRDMFLGKDLFGTLLIILGLVGGFLAISFGSNNKVWPAIFSTLFTVSVMVLIRDLVRRSYLEPTFTLSMLKLEPQYGQFYIFIAALVIGILLALYILRIATHHTVEGK